MNKYDKTKSLAYEIKDLLNINSAFSKINHNTLILHFLVGIVLNIAVLPSMKSRELQLFSSISAYTIELKYYDQIPDIVKLLGC